MGIVHVVGPGGGGGGGGEGTSQVVTILRFPMLVNNLQHGGLLPNRV